MMKFNISGMKILAAFFLIAGPIARPALADSPGDLEKPIRLFATATAGPIGTLESFGKTTIDGHSVYGERSVWGGEMIQADKTTVQVRLDSIGQVSLTRGAIMKLSAAPAMLDGETRGNILIAQLLKGDVDVKLREGAAAYVEACGTTFNASAGASFRLAVNDGRAALDILKGEVQAQDQTAQRKYVIRPVGLGATTSVRARGSRQIQMRVTDENDNPVPDVPVVFLLASQDVGGLGAGTTVSTTVTTNAQGIATASFSAGTTAGTTSITATVAGTSAVWTGTITVTAATAILSGTVIGIVAAAAAAGVTTAVVVAKTGDENRDDNITADPPVIRPGG